MFYVQKWQHMQHEEQKELASHISMHKTFSSRVSPENGYMIAHADTNEKCYNCNHYSNYVVYSYDKVIYSICENCSDEYCYVETWEKETYNHYTCETKYTNGLMTTILQDILCLAIPSFREKMEEYLNKVKEARKWLNSTRRHAFRLSGKILSDKEVLQVVHEKKALKDRTA